MILQVIMWYLLGPVHNVWWRDGLGTWGKLLRPRRKDIVPSQFRARKKTSIYATMWLGSSAELSETQKSLELRSGRLRTVLLPKGKGQWLPRKKWEKWLTEHTTCSPVSYSTTAGTGPKELQQKPDCDGLMKSLQNLRQDEKVGQEARNNQDNKGRFFFICLFLF